MKNFKISIAWLAVLALIFTSCSKEESGVVTDDQELIQVTFGSLMNDFNSQNKQAEPGECSEADPAYVHVAITDSNGDYIGEDDGLDIPDVNFIPIDLKWNSAMSVWETVYTDALALPAGDYTLQYFTVFDADDNVIWVAPRVEGAYGSNVDYPLPQDFVLEAGTKPYITVDVLCYIPRNEDAYGYLFFDINPFPVTNNYCFFVNFCDDATGRDYPAYFSVDVWTEGYESGIHVIDGATNAIDASGANPAASVLCVPLPELYDDDTYFVTVTVWNHADLGYTADAMDYMQFEISQADIDAQLEMTPRYDHVRFECGEDPGNGGGEDCNSVVQCELEDSLDPIPGDICEITFLEGSSDGWIQVNSDSELNLQFQDLGGDFVTVATVDVVLNGTALDVALDTPEGQGLITEVDYISAYAVEVRPNVNGEMSTECWETSCASGDPAYGVIDLDDLDALTYEYPIFIKV